MNARQRFARVVTTVVVRSPGAWRIFRGAMAGQFDRLAPEWDALRVNPLRLRALRAALDAVPEAPRQVLDLGTGTGAAARLAAEQWHDAEITGVDVSPGMIAEARRLASTEREVYDVADASRLPFPDGSFDVVVLNNMIPFFDELARVTAAGGHVVIAFGLGPQTPIWVPLERVRGELERRGFTHVATFEGDPSLALLARKGVRS
jgi:ubiquinone/menaquinone biosynthesis C-methylase UbiE